jgi:hypothetical protein
VAGKRADVSATWVHRGSEGWAQLPSLASAGYAGTVKFDAGIIEMVFGAGMPALPIRLVAAYFFLDSGLSDDTISHVSMVVDWDTTTNNGNPWEWRLYEAPSFSIGALPASLVMTQANNSGTDSALTQTPAAGTKALVVVALSTGGATSTAATYVRFKTMDVFGQSRTTKPRIDEAMVSLATRTGLATSSLSEPVGAMLDDLRVGNGLSKVTAAGGMDYLAKLYAQPFEWYFTDERKFVCRPMPRVPENDAKVIVVGGGNPGLESWDVAEYDEDVPDYACVLYGNKDDTDLPEGWPRRMYRPSTPPDDADLKVEIVDYSGLILKDSDAAAAGDHIVGTGSSGIPLGAIFDADPSAADSGRWPGNNTDPTSAYRELCGMIDGTLSGFAYTAISGWSGTNSPSDPSCLTGDGTNDYVSFGDVAACDFGTGAFTARCWLKLDALPATNTEVVALGKFDSTRGWSLGVTASGLLRGYVGGSGAVVPPVEATGGVITRAGGYTIHTFNTSGAFVVPAGYSLDCTYLVVGGGAPSANCSSDKPQGGSGGGDVLTGSVTLSGSTTIIVAGTGAVGDATGASSLLGAVATAHGGARGATNSTISDGGIGGTSASGKTGGTGSNSSPISGGGGGDSANGGNDGASGGAGGAGTSSSISGAPILYGGGGGGGCTNTYAGGTGTDGGGTGGGSGGQATAGTANRGGGAGGASGSSPYTGQVGGSGVVIVSYAATAAANCRQQTGDTVMATGTWYCAEMSYAGSGGDIALHLNGHAETLTAGGAVGAHDVSNAGNLQLFKGSAAPYMDGSLGRATVWPRALTAGEALTDYGAGQGSYNRSLAKGTVVLQGVCRNRQGAPVPAHHVRAGWWIQNLETGSTAPLYITGHSVDLAGKKNALTIGQDWMEKEIGVRMAELLAIPPTVVPDAVQDDYSDPYTPDAPYEPPYEPEPYVDPTVPDEPDPMTPPPPMPTLPGVAPNPWTNPSNPYIQPPKPKIPDPFRKA